jgi:HlyD family secretion protein
MANQPLFRKGAYSGSGGRARTTVVQVGHRNAQSAEELSGLSINDRVALLPSDRIKEGFSVAQREPR